MSSLAVNDEDDDEAIYQPLFGRKNLEVPRSHYGRSTSLSPIAQSPVPSPIEDIENPELRSAPPSRDSSRSSKAKTKHLDWCEEEDCEICEYLINRKRSKFFFSSGVVADSSRYNANIHTLNKPTSSHGRSKSVDPTRQKPYFAKKLGQLDAAMKIVAAKVDQNVWEEKYLEAEELQSVMIWLRSVNRKLRKMLEKREKHVENYDFKAAQKAKEDYEAEIKDASVL
uniref:Uncharacterized protein n=1 Tax=Panagrolaimus superbus TaxID=310955 RepID=A0A914XZT1_9BILA